MSLFEWQEKESTDQSELEEEEEVEEGLKEGTDDKFSSFIDMLRDSLTDLITSSKDQAFKLHALAQLNADEHSLNSVLKLKLSHFKQRSALVTTGTRGTRSRKEGTNDPFTDLESVADDVLASSVRREAGEGGSGSFESLEDCDEGSYTKCDNTNDYFDSLE